MRLVLAVLLPVVAGCGNPLSCESLNDLQSDASLQTCTHAGSLGEGTTVAVPLDGGGTTTIDGMPSGSSRTTFEDGAHLSVSDSLATIRSGSSDDETVAVGAWGYSAAAPVGDRYALALGDGRLSIRSQSSPAVLEQPVEVEMELYGDVPLMKRVPLSFSGDGTRLAVVDATRHAFVLDAETGARIWETTLAADAEQVSLSSDGSQIAVALDDKSVCVWSIAGAAESACRTHRRRVADATFSPDDGTSSSGTPRAPAPGARTSTSQTRSRRATTRPGRARSRPRPRQPWSCGGCADPSSGRGTGRLEAGWGR